MERHLSQAEWDHVFSSQATAAEVEGAVAHLAGCGPCWNGAARATAGLTPRSFGDARDAILRLFEAQESAARRLLLARTIWAARLKSLDAVQQVKRLKADPALRTREMFDTVLAEASAAAPEDPLLGEEWAGAAYTLAGLLPDSACPQELREDLQGAALLTVANARRLAADWAGSAAALDAARRHFEKGTGDPKREARLLSIQSSLASDTGHLERALSLLARAAEAGRRSKEPSVLPSLAVQEASTLLAACRYEHAAARADGALALLPSGEPRLELLAWSIAAESLVFLEHPADALRSYAAALPLYEQATGCGTRLRRSYLEALLLDAFGFTQEADRAFRTNIAKWMEAEHYKDALLTMLTHFEILVRKGLPERAERACEEALRLTRQVGPGCHGQMIELWQGLLSLLRAGRLAKHHLVEARAYLVRSWHAPAANGPLRQIARAAIAESPSPELRTVPEAPLQQPVRADGQPSPESVVACGYKEEMERLERELIMKGLAQCGGSVSETARLLQIARGTLREKMKKHGLFGGTEPEALPPLQGISLSQEEQQALLNGIRAQAAWEELANRTPGRLASRIETVAWLRTPEMFGAILAAARTAAGEDPDLGARRARLAHAVAGMLSRTTCPPRRRSDLQAEAMMTLANCLRLAGDFSGAVDALDAAQRHLAQGTGDAAKQVRLLSLRASLASDTGHAAEALEQLARATGLDRQARASAHSLAIQEASTLLAAFRYEEALTRAEAALSSLPPGESRLELLARSIATESLAHLGRGSESLRSLTASRPLFRRLQGRQNDLLLGYLEALVLDTLDLPREAEDAFRANVEGWLEAERYKDAQLTLLTWFERLHRRGDLAGAVRVAREALKLFGELEPQRRRPIQELWNDLLTRAERRELADRDLLEARDFAMKAFARKPTKKKPGRLPVPGDRLLRVKPAAPLPERLKPGDFRRLLNRRDQDLMQAALSQCQGNLHKTCRMLGIAPGTLRERIGRNQIVVVKVKN